ncbi:hypothetical protein Bca101_010266 [Brassica carinata]
MRAGSNPSPISSSIGVRVRSKKSRDAVDPPESTDSSDFSLDLTAVVENPGQAIVERASPVAEMERLPPTGPISSIGVEEVESWRQKFGLSNDVAIRIRGPIDRVSDFEVDEVPVYEGFFESGFRDRVPSLVAKISGALGISPGQLNPPSWRTLIALQNLGDLEGLTIGVAEVLYSYSVSSMNTGEGRYHLRPRSKTPPVQEIPKRERTTHPVFESYWAEKFAFMYLPGFSSIWRVAGGSREFRISFSLAWF